MFKYRLIMVFILTLCAGCSSATPTASEAAHITTQLSSVASAQTTLASPTPISSLSPTPSIDIAMYEAVINQHFLPGNSVEQLVRSKIFTPTVVYIEPNWRTGEPVPPAIIGLVLHYTDALSLTHVLAEQPGGVVIRISEPRIDEPYVQEAGKVGPTIAISSSISGDHCVSSHSTTYALTRTPTGWNAESFLIGEC